MFFQLCKANINLINMNHHKRRSFRPRPKNGFRRRSGSISSNSSNSLTTNGNVNYSRNGSTNNIHSVEKTMHKFQQLAKDAQSNGDPVLAQNYLQHADHYLRRFNDLSDKKENFKEKTKFTEKTNLPIPSSAYHPSFITAYPNI